MAFVQLITRLKKREEPAFKELVFSFSKRLLTVAMLYSKDREDAEDVLQDALIKVFQNIDSFTGHEERMFYGWMKKIVINECLTRSRRRYRKSEKSLEEMDIDKGIEPEAVQSLYKQELIDIITTLPNGYREVFALFVLEGYSHQEIAERMGIKESSSRSQLVRAKKLLRKKITHHQKFFADEKRS